jgi:hypothetical protein
MYAIEIKKLFPSFINPTHYYYHYHLVNGMRNKGGLFLRPLTTQLGFCNGGIFRPVQAQSPQHPPVRLSTILTDICSHNLKEVGGLKVVF